jgi:splicing factor 3B subunit 2
VSRKKKKQLRWLKVAELKAKVARPDLVEAWDITAPDPFTLVYMKTLRNTVAVPKHWAQKRRFLSGRRGF